MAGYAGEERRRSPRIKGGIKVKVMNKNIPGLIPLRNTSFHGAFLRTSHRFELDEIIDLRMYLPITYSTINVKARVARIATYTTFWGRRMYEVGIEMLDLSR